MCKIWNEEAKINKPTNFSSVILDLHTARSIKKKHSAYQLFSAVDVVYRCYARLISLTISLLSLIFFPSVFMSDTLCSGADKNNFLITFPLPSQESTQTRHVCTSAKWRGSGASSATGP